MTPTAPAACAFDAFSKNEHVPRRISTILPANVPGAKGDGTPQPSAVEAGVPVFASGNVPAFGASGEAVACTYGTAVPLTVKA